MAQKKIRPRNAKPEKARRIGLIWGGIVFVTITVGSALYLFSYRDPRANPVGEGKNFKPIAASHVGSQVCVACHANEYEAWKGSDHALAMQHANAQTVLGNFDNAKFTYANIASSFFKRDGKFYVNTDGPDGKLRDYEIKYTFGVRPLQQYLIEFPDGRIQSLTIAWDTRPRKEGGQRWFHLYPKERITHGDELHWTRPAQNWNFMCADCHSTGLRKNYDPVADRFQAQWTEINVGCEACHGSGSQHVTWAHSKKRGKSSEDKFKALTVSLDERHGIAWNQNSASGNAARSKPRVTEREIEVCAQCHARRGQIAEGYEAGKLFLDYYRPALLARLLYHADGQQRDEVYIWGSFLQSKMYASGVTCSDCHNPHSGKLHADGNTVCAACHLPSKYDAAAHHHHRPGSAGAACAACHMPTTTYMVVDPRHDHSLRVPRPDLSAQLGTPNACNGCHTNRDARWAAAQVNKWYGHDAQGYQRFAPALFAANVGALDAPAQLRAIAADASHPAIVRATALAQLNASDSQRGLETSAKGLRDPNPLLRLAALQSLANAPLAARVSLAVPVLGDPLKALRIEAVSLLAPVPPDQLSATQRDAFERASAEYVASQRYNADRAEARVNLGTFYANRGQAAKAEEEIKVAIGLNPHFIPAYVNLADLYRARGRDAEGERILRDGLKITPKSAMLRHALGLALVRLKRSDAALGELERATVLEPGNARFTYVYAVALHSTGKSDAAIAKLKVALAAHPNDLEILEALATFHSARGESAAAKKYAQRLQAIEEKVTSGK